MDVLATLQATSGMEGPLLRHCEGLPGAFPSRCAAQGLQSHPASSERALQFTLYDGTVDCSLNWSLDNALTLCGSG